MPIGGYPKLKGYLVERDIKQEKVADLLGISRTTVSTILNGKRNADFSMSQVMTLAKEFNLSRAEVDRLFFDFDVPFTQR